MRYINLFNLINMLRHSFYKENEIRIPERKTVDIEEYYDIEYWSKKFGITPELLQKVVKESGSNDAETVEKYIHDKYSI